MINYFEQEVALKKSKLKKDIRITSGKCAKILLILPIMMIISVKLIGIIIKLRANRAGFDMGINSETGMAFGLPKEVFEYLTAYLPCILGDIVAIIIGMKITKIKIKSDMFCKNESSGKFITLGAVSCIAVGIISGIVYAIYSYLLEIGGIKIPAPDFNFPKGNTLMLVLFLGYVCVLGPILEEIIFRGFILKSMQKFGNLTAIIVTSILFSMFHLNLVQFVPPVLIGLILGIITVKSKSLVPSIIAHIFNNTVTFAMSSIPSNAIILQGVIFMIYTFGSLLGLAFFIKNYGKEIKRIIKEDTKLLKTYKKVFTSFSGFWSILYIAFYLILVGGTLLLNNIK